MTELDDLIRGALAAPADLAPRLVLCDYLEERDDPRGRVLRASLALPGADLGGAVHADPWSSGPGPVRRLAARLALVAWGRRTGQWLPMLGDAYLTACELAACRLLVPADRDRHLWPVFSFILDGPGGTFRRQMHPVGCWSDRLRKPIYAAGSVSWLPSEGTSVILAANLMRAARRCHDPFGQVWVPAWRRREARRLLEVANERLSVAACEFAYERRGESVYRRWSAERFVSLPGGRKARVPA